MTGNTQTQPLIKTVSFQCPMSSNVAPNGRTHFSPDHPQTDRKSVTDSKADLVRNFYSGSGIFLIHNMIMVRLFFEKRQTTILLYYNKNLI